MGHFGFFYSSKNYAESNDSIDEQAKPNSATYKAQKNLKEYNLHKSV